MNKIFEKPGISRGEIQKEYQADTGRTGENINVWKVLNSDGYVKNIRNGQKNALFLTKLGAVSLIDRIIKRTGVISDDLRKSILDEASFLNVYIKKFEIITRVNKMNKDFV